MGHHNDPETNPQDTAAQVSLSSDGLRILARIIARQLEKETQQLEPETSTEEGAPYDE